MLSYLSATQVESAQQLIAQNDRLEGFVISGGNLDPKLVLVAEAPGAKEIATGLPFMGPSGKELDRWLTELNLDRSAIYFTKTVLGRPFRLKNGRKSDRKPTGTEMKTFAPFLDSELAHFADHLIVPLGGAALERLLGPKAAITQLHGQLITTPVQRLNPATLKYEETAVSYRLFPLFHPSYVRRFPSKRELAEQDLGKLKQLLTNEADK